MSSQITRDETMRSHYESVERVIAAMRDRMDQPLSLGSMAKIAFASRYHFNRTFRQVTGVPPSQFLYALRLERAKRLLAQTQQKVIDICYGVGYNSVGTFTRRFTNLLGVSPKAFRERAQSPSALMEEYANGAADADGAYAGSGCHVSGYVTAPARFHGLIFIGLFETAIPQGKPVACVVTTKSGPYHFAAPQGEFYLYALGLESPIQAPDCFHYESALRGGGHLLQISPDSVDGTTYLRVRPPAPFDPPILLALPLLMKTATTDGHGARDHSSSYRQVPAYRQNPGHRQTAGPPIAGSPPKLNRQVAQ